MRCKSKSVEFNLSDELRNNKPSWRARSRGAQQVHQQRQQKLSKKIREEIVVQPPRLRTRPFVLAKTEEVPTDQQSAERWRNGKNSSPIRG